MPCEVHRSLDECADHALVASVSHFLITRLLFGCMRGNVLHRFVLGEGIEKKTNDLAKEVEAQTKAFEEAAAKKAASAPESPAPTQEAAAEPAQACPPPAHAVLSCRRNGSRLGACNHSCIFWPCTKQQCTPPHAESVLEWREVCA